VQVLGQVDSHAALGVLITISLDDPDPDVRDVSLAQVIPRQTSNVVEAYVKRLDDANNARINRAASALAQLDDRSATGPLIDALVTLHAFQVRPASSGTTNTVFHGPDPIESAIASRALTGLPLGGQLPSSTGFASGSDSGVEFVPMLNQDVLSALVKLSGGQSFGFDIDAWRAWHNAQRQQQQTQEINARRDDSP
jgi:hypothetical protein